MIVNALPSMCSLVFANLLPWRTAASFKIYIILPPTTESQTGATQSPNPLAAAYALPSIVQYKELYRKVRLESSLTVEIANRPCQILYRDRNGVLRP